MSAITPATEARRVTQTLLVLNHMFHGKSKKEACEIVGIHPDTFDKWVVAGNEMIETFQLAFIEAERTRLTNVTNVESVAINKLLSLIPNMENPFALMKTITFLSNMRKELEEKLGANTERNTADDFLVELNGPATRVEQSKMTTTVEGTRAAEAIAQKSVEFNITPQSDGSINIRLPKKVEILDIELDPRKAMEDDNSSDKESKD